MSDDLDVLRALAEKATPGPWGVSWGRKYPRVVTYCGQFILEGGVYNTARTEVNANYIAALSPDVVLRLIARVAELEKDAARYRWLRDLRCNQLYVQRDGDHACNYMTAAQWIDESPREFADTPPEEIAAMKATNTIWSVQVYKHTPVGFNIWYAATLDAAIDAAMVDSYQNTPPEATPDKA